MTGASEPGPKPAGRTSNKPRAPRVNARMAISAERRAQAFKLKKAAVSNQEIADKLGVTRQAVGKMLRTTMSELKSETDDAAVFVRTLEMARLDDMFVRCYQNATKANPDLRFLDRALKIVEMRLKISGALLVEDEDLGPQRAREKAALVRDFLDGMMSTVPGAPPLPEGAQA